MNLNLWTIYYELSAENKTPLISDDSSTINNARMMTANMAAKSEIVYIGKASLLYEGKDNGSVIVHNKDHILIEEYEVDVIFNEVSDILDKYNKWEKQLESCLKKENGLQQMIDCSQNFLKHPAYIYGPDGKALAISSGYSPSIHWHWKEILENRGLTSYRMRSLRDSIDLYNVFKDIYPTTRNSKMGGHQYMHCSIWANDYMAGHLVLFSMNYPFETGLEAIVMAFVKFANVYMLMHYEEYNPTSSLSKTLSQLLSGQRYDRNTLLYLLQNLRWDIYDEYQLYCLQEYVEDNLLVPKTYLYLIDKLRASVILKLDKMIVVVENNTRRKTSMSIASQLSAPQLEEYLCGVSVPFNDLTKGDLFYMQAKEEVNRAINGMNKYSDAAEHTIDHLCSLIKADPIAETYINRTLLVLKSYDKENGTEYYKTLRSYFYHGFQINEAAKELKIHRNSFNYRLNKIRSIVDFGEIDKIISSDSRVSINKYLFSFLLIDCRD